MADREQQFKGKQPPEVLRQHEHRATESAEDRTPHEGESTAKQIRYQPRGNFEQQHRQGEGCLQGKNFLHAQSLALKKRHGDGQNDEEHLKVRQPQRHGQVPAQPCPLVG